MPHSLTGPAVAVELPWWRKAAAWVNAAIRDWWEDTHSKEFELLRHFLLRFFDSELITSPGQSATVVISAFSLVAPWFMIWYDPLKAKYAYFSGRPTAGPYLQAVHGDELWLLTLFMAAVGLLTAVKWPSLFPTLRDYRALGSLPLRSGQIFKAKLWAVLIMATAAVITLNLLPGTLFPMVSAGRWAISPIEVVRMRAHTAASMAGCYFLFFAIMALQGVLLNVLKPRAFRRITGSMQGLLVAVMLILMVLSFSIQPKTADVLLRPEMSRWLPPVWFLGLLHTLEGDADPAMHALAWRAAAALGIAVAAGLLCYAISYGRHRQLLVEGVGSPSRDRKWPGVLLGWILPDPRQQAVVVFMAKTLARSSHHRMILMGYGGFGVAVVMTGLLGIFGVMERQRAFAAAFVYTHVIMLIFLLLGIRHLFSIPTELKANWTFQLTEREGRATWLRAIDRFVLFWGAVLMVVLPLPFEARLIGWRAVGEMALFIAFGLLCYDSVFSEWEKLPFTCSQLPGKTPGWILTLYLLGILTAIPMVNGLMLITLYNNVALGIVLAILAGIWSRLHVARRESWGELRLKYDEAPDPAVHGLNLMA